MHSIVFQDRNAPTLLDRPVPKPGPGEVLVEIHASGICHTDIEVLRGNYGTGAFPLTPGHEFAGEVVDLGPEVQGLSVGARVVVDPNLECGTCAACARGWAHLCERLGAYGVSTNGGFAEYCVVQAARVYPIGAMPYEVAALAEPIGCVLNGLSAAHVERAQNALIFGAGPIGLLMAMGMQVAGVGSIALVDIDESRLELVESFGFRAIAANSDSLRAAHQGVDLVADATNVPAVAAGLTNYIANGGVGLFFGVCHADVRIEISPFELFRRQITLAGSHSLNHNIPEALETLTKYGNGIARVVSHRLPLSEVQAVFEGKGPKGSLKIQYIRD